MASDVAMRQKQRNPATIVPFLEFRAKASCLTIKERYSKIDCQWGRGCRTDGCLYRHPSDEPVGPALTLELKPQPAVYAAGYPAEKMSKAEKIIAEEDQSLLEHDEDDAPESDGTSDIVLSKICYVEISLLVRSLANF
eukprot:g19605.t1